MANPRVHEIASDLGVDVKVILKTLQEMGEHVKAASSAVAPPVARKLKSRLQDGFYQPIVELFPRFNSIGYGQLVDSFLELPKSTLSFIGQLASGIDTGSASRLLFNVAQTGEVFWIRGTDAEAFERAASDAQPLTANQLFARTGVLVLENKEPGKYRSYAFVAWNLATKDHLEFTWIRVAVDDETDRYGKPRLEATAPYYTERSASEGVFALGRRREIRSLSALYDLVPIKSRGEAKGPGTAEDKPAKPADYEESDFVRLYRYKADPRERRAGTRSGMGRSSHHVRGHVRRQPYPSTGEVREIWIKPYQTGEGDDPSPTRKPYLVKPVTNNHQSGE